MIALGCDHGGINLKTAIMKYLDEKGIEYKQEFIPVMSFIHTFDVRNMTHDYYSNSAATYKYYTNNYYGNPANHDDRMLMRSFRNTLGVSMREGFNKWAPFGLTAFATHELLLQKQKYEVAPEDTSYTGKTRNRLSVGGEISKRMGDLFHYGATGEVWVAGYGVGDFKINADQTVCPACGCRRLTRSLPGGTTTSTGCSARN